MSVRWPVHSRIYRDKVVGGDDKVRKKRDNKTNHSIKKQKTMLIDVFLFFLRKKAKWKIS